MTNEPTVVLAMRHYADRTPSVMTLGHGEPREIVAHLDALTAERDALAARLDALEPLARALVTDLMVASRWAFEEEARAILALLDTTRTEAR